MEFYHYIPLLTIVVGAAIAGIHSYVKERNDIKKQEALTKKNSTPTPSQKK
jgi:hypothetical protein